MKILVIDDEKPTLSMFKLFLSAYGYEVHAAEDGEKGLKMYDTISPDMVFTDIKMPGIDGLEVLRRIREKDKNAQVIIITGHGDMEKAVEALDLDASDFINKPVERQAIDSALARAEKRRKRKDGFPFDYNLRLDGSTIEIELTGRLSGENLQEIEDRLDALNKGKTAAIRFITDEGFSINRSGIGALMTMMQRLGTADRRITIENLSYSYCRVFQMAGMDKMATLVEEILPE